MVVTRGMIKEILWSGTLRLMIGWPRHPRTCAGLVIEMELLVNELVSARVRVANGWPVSPLGVVRGHLAWPA